MEKLIDLIYRTMSEKEVTLVPEHWSARGLTPRREFKDLYPYEKEALGYLADKITQYYKTEKYNE